MSAPVIPQPPAPRVKGGTLLGDIGTAIAGFGAGVRAETEEQRRKALEAAMQAMRERQVAAQEGTLGLQREQFGFERGETLRKNTEEAASRPALLERIQQLS